MTPGTASPIFGAPWAPGPAQGLAVVAVGLGLWAAAAFGLGGPAGAVLTGAGREAAQMREAAAAEHEAFVAVYRDANLVTVEIQPGETFAVALQRSGAPAAEAAAALRAAGAVFEVGRVRPGMTVDLTLQRETAGVRLAGLSFRSSPGEAVTVSREQDGGFNARAVQMPLTFEIARIAAVVQGSFYESAIALGATEAEVGLFAEVFGYDVDFQRDIREGDRFEIVFERFYDDQGQTVRTGDPLFLALETRRGWRTYYRFQASDADEPEWYDGGGRSARKALMRTPINGARLSSGYGLRLHPIIGYTRMHRGIDFAAPVGTPIMAAGDGVVEAVDVRGGYGLYVRLQHRDGFETVYAHMSRFAPGLRAGQRVEQGQTIGYVGSTGASTGPHLHYEVMVNGNHINPTNLDVGVGTNLEGEDLVAFIHERNRIDRLRDARAVEAVQASLHSAVPLRQPAANP
jgi:murein DD-endopeptidase MepM/ murein hydrolase activator NlpD